MRVPRVSPIARLGANIVALAGVFLLAVAADGSLARGRDRHEDGPRLELSGACVVSPGRTIELTWSRDASVRELEILMSTDGGRHFSVQVSPSLDPSLGRFTWRVPRAAGADVRLRVRFNRGGREIEGPPVAVACAPAEHGALPLALPPFSGGAPEPRPVSTSARVGAQALAVEEEDDALDSPAAHVHPCDADARVGSGCGAFRAWAPNPSRPLDTSPHNVPLRT